MSTLAIILYAIIAWCLIAACLLAMFTGGTRLDHQASAKLDDAIARKAANGEPPVAGCRAPNHLCPRAASCSRHNACEWETWAQVNPPRPGTV